MHALKSTDYKRQSGFALVVALSLMAFVLMLILSMSLLVQVETTNASRSLDQLRAKEAARLALMMAIGELQKHAGPDQRVTARAEILGDDLDFENPFWTGVWNTANTGAAPRWLVSWLDQTGNPPSKRVRVVGNDTVGANAADFVDVPVIDVTGDSNQVIDEIAWWVADEGVKTSVASLPLYLREDPNFLESTSIESLNLQLASTHGLETIFSSYDRFSSTDASKLDRIQSINQLLGQADFSNEVKIDLAGESAYHSLTPSSYGVLSSVLPNADGGLMSDLSIYTKLLGTAVEEYLLLGEEHAASQALATTDTNALRLIKDMQGLDEIGTLTDGEFAVPISPILTNLAIAFNIRQNDKSDPNVYLRMIFFCELWNPFTHTLKTSTDAGDSIDLQIEITGLPKIDIVKYADSGTEKATSLLNLENLLADPNSPEKALVIRLQGNDSEEWLPGRSKNWTGINGADESAGSSPYFSTLTTSKFWNYNKYKLGKSDGIDTQVDLPTGDNSDGIRHFSANEEETTLRIKLYAYNTSDDSKSLLAEYGDITYCPVDTRDPTNSVEPYPYPFKHKEMSFGYHIINRGPHLSADDQDFFRGRWLRHTDPRNPSPFFGIDWYKNLDPQLDSGSPYIPVIDGISILGDPTPESLNQTNSAINFITFRRLLDRSSPSKSFNKLWQDAPLFELPRERVLSLASLQHIYIHNERPFQVGNSWAADGKKNELEWFDRYYFSGISRGDVAADYDQKRGLPNPGLITYKLKNPGTSISDWQTENADNEGASRKPAENLMVANRFNLNSTSVAAWKSMLGSLQLDSWSYLDYPEDDTSDLSSLTTRTESREGTFARFSNSLQETYEAPASPPTLYYNKKTENVAPSAFYRHGARRFDSTDIECLAKEIVRQLKLKRMPFVSMKDFLSVEEGKQTSLLENVIKIVLAPTVASRSESLNTSPHIKTSTSGRQQWFHKWETLGERDPSEVAIDIDHFSPGFLTQADIMTAIGPMLSPRSDTFKIRARGESLGTRGETVGVATIEATIQRMPEPVDPANDPAAATNRQFKLLSVHWLAENEI